MANWDKIKDRIGKTCLGISIAGLVGVAAAIGDLEYNKNKRGPPPRYPDRLGQLQCLASQANYFYWSQRRFFNENKERMDQLGIAQDYYKKLEEDRKKLEDRLNSEIETELKTPEVATYRDKLGKYNNTPEAKRIGVDAWIFQLGFVVFGLGMPGAIHYLVNLTDDKLKQLK